MTFRSALTFAALVAAVGLLGGQVRSLLADPTVWPPDDFVEYWAAGRLNLEGENPYDPALLLPLERFAGRETDEAVMMWNPPWTLSFVMPVGALPPRVAQLAWLLLHLALLGFCVDRLWRVYGGRAARRWVAWAVLLTFVPTYLVLNTGQIGPLLVLGATLFVWFARRGWEFAAGAATVLLAIKPHLAYLVWLAIAVDALTHRRWRMLAGGAAAGLLATAVPLALNPHVFGQYFAALRDHTPAQWVSLTLGSVLRMAFGEGRFWLNFVPMLLGLAWFASRLRDRGGDADWADRLPPLLLVSFVTAPYGAWHFDLVLLLVPLVHRAATLAPADPRAPVAAGVYLLANFVMLGLNAAQVLSIWFVWVAPLVLGLYLWTGRAVRPAPRLAVAPA